MSSAAKRQKILGWTFDELAERWGKSPFTIRRLHDEGHLASIVIGATRYIPSAEVERAEREGCGVPRKRKVREQRLPEPVFTVRG